MNGHREKAKESTPLQADFYLFLFPIKLCVAGIAAMFAARPASKRAARIAHTLPQCYTPARMVGGARSASTGIPTKKPAHRVAGGQNSMLVGTAVLGATLLVGYAFGRGESVEKAAHKTLG